MKCTSKYSTLTQYVRGKAFTLTCVRDSDRHYGGLHGDGNLSWANDCSDYAVRSLLRDQGFACPCARIGTATDGRHTSPHGEAARVMVRAESAPGECDQISAYADCDACHGTGRGSDSATSVAVGLFPSHVTEEELDHASFYTTTLPARLAAEVRSLRAERVLLYEQVTRVQVRSNEILERFRAMRSFLRGLRVVVTQGGPERGPIVLDTLTSPELDALLEKVRG